MEASNSAYGVSLPQGETGSSFLRRLLSETADAFPSEFEGFKITSSKSFKKNYDSVLVEFEAHRLASKKRSEIAKFIIETNQKSLQFKTKNYEGSFEDYLKNESAAIKLDVYKGSSTQKLTPIIPFQGKRYKASQFKSFGEHLRKENKVTKAVSQALTWLSQYTDAHGGILDLSDKKFVIFGASAELAPTRLLLEAGASVLWIDIKAPTQLISETQKYSGKLYFSRQATDLLRQPKEVKSAIEAFAEGSKVHIGMFAYAAGASQEWRLAASMNAIVFSLKTELIGSVSMLISPTSVAMTQPEDLKKSSSNRQKLPLWQNLLKTVGHFPHESSLETQGVAVARAIVPLQGVSYQAAQYVSKTLAAEVFAIYGNKLDGTPIRVSSNVAGITKTRSLQHPVFQAAFLGAKSFGVEIFETPTTANLSAMLIFHDILNEDFDCSKDIQKLFSQQVHGGVYALAFSLKPMIEVAAVLGLIKKPKLILGLLK